MTSLTQKPGRLLECLYVVLALLIFLRALHPLFTGGSDLDLGPGTEGNIRFQATTLAIYLIAVGVVLAHFQALTALVQRNSLLIFLLLIPLASAVWSVHPMASLRRAVALELTFLFCIYLAIRFRPRDLLFLLGWALVLSAAASLIVIFVAPHIGIHGSGRHDGIWRGVFGHKNSMGQAMALGVVIFVIQARMYAGLWRVWAVGGLIGCAFMLLMSQSRTALVAAVLTLAMLFLLQGLRQSRVSLAVRLFAVGVFGLGTLAFLIIQFHEEILALLGRNASLTGRTKLWQLAFAAGLENPILGSGYRAFWTEERAAEVYSGLWAEVGNGHNGFLDLWLELGLLGLAAFVGTLFIMGRRAWAQLVNSTDAFGVWYSAFLVFILIASMADSFLLQQSESLTVLYFLNLLYLSAPAKARASPAAARAYRAATA